jgi:translation initiation factor IF-1
MADRISRSGGNGAVMKESTVEMTGVVIGVNRDLLSVALNNGAVVKAKISGRMFKKKIRVLSGDKVAVEVSPYDVTRGRITYRFK